MHSVFQDHHGIFLKNSSFVDGTIYCKFTRKAETNVEDRKFDLAKEKYHLLIAAGTSLRGKILFKVFLPSIVKFMG
jgi:DOMON domain.